MNLKTLFSFLVILSISFPSYSADKDDAEVIKEYKSKVNVSRRCKEPGAKIMTTAIDLAQKVEQKLLKLRESYQRRGEVLNFALVSRMGTDMSDLKLLKREYSAQTAYETARKAIDKVKAEGVPEDKRVLPLKRVVQLNMIKDKDKLIYSHMGILVFPNVLPGNERMRKKFRFVHELIGCDTLSPRVYKEAMFRFFSDFPKDWGAHIIIPTEELQTGLERVLENVFIKDKGIQKKRYRHLLRGNKYNLLAGAFQEREQNSNQFPLEVMAMALASEQQIAQWDSWEDGDCKNREKRKRLQFRGKTKDSKSIQCNRYRRGVQKILEKTKYKATTVMLTGFKKAGTIPLVATIMGGVFNLDDKNTKMYLKKANVADVVTARSVKQWMENNKLVEDQFEVYLSDQEVINHSEFALNSYEEYRISREFMKNAGIVDKDSFEEESKED